VFSNGPTWVQHLSDQLGSSTLRPRPYGGRDFACGGAEASPLESGITGVAANVISLPSQLTQFESQVGAAPSDALYTLSIGTDDLVSIMQAPGSNAAGMIARVPEAVANVVSFVTGLAADGARSFIVLDAPDLGKLPVITRQNDPGRDALTLQLSSLYNVHLNAALQNLAQTQGLNLHILPTYPLLDQGSGGARAVRPGQCHRSRLDW